jgi:hypothetical protein
LECIQLVWALAYLHALFLTTWEDQWHLVEKANSLTAKRVDYLLFVRGFPLPISFGCRLGREEVITTRKARAVFFGPRSTIVSSLDGRRQRLRITRASGMLTYNSLCLTAFSTMEGGKRRRTTTNSAFFAQEAETGKDGQPHAAWVSWKGGRLLFLCSPTRRNGSDEWSIGSSPTMRCWTESRAFFDVASQTRRLSLPQHASYLRSCASLFCLYLVKLISQIQQKKRIEILGVSNNVGFLLAT